MALLCHRARLGFLFGHRLVYLVHTGRKSGRRREVVLEVVRYAPGEIVVVAGWGARSDWFRNLEAAPILGVPEDPRSAGDALIRLRAIAFHPV